MENLMKGSSGENVKLLQERLQEAGYYKGKINGEFDDKTEEAVKYFQEKNGLAVDGIAGLITRDFLDLKDANPIGETEQKTDQPETSKKTKTPEKKKSPVKKKTTAEKKTRGGKKNA